MTEMPIAPEPESLAKRAARATLANNIERVRIYSPDENPLSALGWAMGDVIEYEAALEQIVAEAITLFKRDEGTLAFSAGDDVVSHYEDETGVWTVLELTEDDEAEEWHTTATLLLSDVEATDLARRLTDRTAP